MTKVELTTHLHAFFPVLAGRELLVEASTVAEVIDRLEAMAPGFAFYVCDERGRLRRHVNVFVGDEMIADRRRLSDPVGPDSRVFIAQALSGG
ncbi:MAG: MoaD/ThiS family protein [Myxococcales bacterium]|nr:MoaD/ThiS family protein [Myxococcales bacterium]MCB9714297.1 MoaD/ThiS family protein [Myxococcales bacterium]